MNDNDPTSRRTIIFVSFLFVDGGLGVLIKNVFHQFSDTAELAATSRSSAFIAWRHSSNSRLNFRGELVKLNTEHSHSYTEN